jgi:hypothetical protein
LSYTAQFRDKFGSGTLKKNNTKRIEKKKKKKKKANVEKMTGEVNFPNFLHISKKNRYSKEERKAKEKLKVMSFNVYSSANGYLLFVAYASMSFTIPIRLSDFPHFPRFIFSKRYFKTGKSGKFRRLR